MSVLGQGQGGPGRSPVHTPARSRKGSHCGSLLGSYAGSHAGSHSSAGGSPLGSQLGPPHSPAPRYVLLRHCLAISLRRTGCVPLGHPGPLQGPLQGSLQGPPPLHRQLRAADLCDAEDDDDSHLPGPGPGPGGAPGLEDNDFWMYDNGYLLFQGFVEANARCFWSAALLEAMRELSFEGYVSPGVLLVRAGACALDVVRAAWARRVLKPPPNYLIEDVGDVEDCCVVGVAQSQFTPLPEALCWVILELTSTGQAAVLPAILRALPRAFPAMTRPDSGLVYDALAKLSTDRKVYQTARGYFLVTPETRRRLASMQHHGAGARAARGRRSMLLSNEEAIVMVHGDMQTERDGPRTHQCVQTNLADVICGGNPEDKVLYPRVDRLRSAEPDGGGGRALERRHSLRLSTRLGQALQRAGSLRSLPPRPPPSASPASAPAPGTPGPEKKQSLLSRLFRRSGRSGRAGPRPRGRRGQSAPPAPGSTPPHPPPHPARAPSPNIRTFSAQFPVQDDEDADRPPADWFNPGVTARASVGTQTQTPSPCTTPSASPPPRSASSPAVSRWDGAGRASTLPRSLSRGSPRRARRLSDSLSVSLLSAGGVDHHHLHHHHHHRASSPASHASRTSHASHASRAPTMSSAAAASPSPSPTKIPSGKLLVPGARKTSPSNTLLSTTSSRASRASASTSGMSKASSGYNSSRSAPGSAPGTRSGSPARRSLPVPSKTTCTSAPTSTGSVISARNSTTTTTATINGANTKIFVEQHNSPVRSVITIENRSGGGALAATLGTSLGSGRGRPRGPVLETSFDRVVPKSSESSGGGGAGGSASDSGSGSGPPGPPGPSTEADRYSSNKINNHNLSGKTAASSSSSSSTSSEESLTSAGSLVAKEAEMNNSRKQSVVAAPVGFLRESLSYKNILKEVQKLSPAPLPAALPAALPPLSASPYASLSDLSVHCKSLAAQRILSGVSINSIDTLVEVNMAAEKKQANCDVTIRTDFGMV